jgi:hypothetical protein
MKAFKLSLTLISKAIFFICLFVGLSISGYSQNKLQKDGKVKHKDKRSSDHHQKEVHKDGKHRKEFRHHSGNENQTFSKKKKKKLK